MSSIEYTRLWLLLINARNKNSSNQKIDYVQAYPTVLLSKWLCYQMLEMDRRGDSGRMNPRSQTQGLPPSHRKRVVEAAVVTRVRVELHILIAVTLERSRC